MRRRGFTLIELLVVLAIISLLLTVLMPSLAKAKELARRTVCLGNMHHIGLGMHAYTNAYNCWPSNDTTGTQFITTGRLAEFLPPVDQKYPWMNVNRVFACPSQATTGTSGDYAFVTRALLNDWPVWPNADKMYARPVIAYRAFRKVNDPNFQRPPSEVGIAGDGAQPASNVGYHYADIYAMEMYAKSGFYWASVVPRHDKYTVLLFQDFHAEATRWSDIDHLVDKDGVPVYKCTWMFDPRYSTKPKTK